MGTVPMSPASSLRPNYRGRLGDSALARRRSRRRSREPTIPGRLKKICARATALDPAARHPTARALADELEQWLHEQESTGGHNRSPLFDPRLSRPRPSFWWPCSRRLRHGIARPGPLLDQNPARSAHQSAAACQLGKAIFSRDWQTRRAAADRIVTTDAPARTRITIKKDNLLEFDKAEQAAAKGI